MIYGLIPVGGKGIRLGLPYSKEMLPQKNFYHFNPICNHIVKKMELAGASKIYFVHGLAFKKDLKNFFEKSNYVHILQSEVGFANVIKDFYDSNPDLKKEDKIIFGLPDSIFDQNPFIEMLNKQGTVCGLFSTDKATKVDRLEINKNKFQIKVKKTDKNQDKFWGILKFDGSCIKRMIKDKVFDKFNEIGEIINLYPFSCVDANSYFDLGTWQNYNRYLTNTKNFSNFEIEKKYEASDIDLDAFLKTASVACDSHVELTSTDHYYTINNPNIEFVRYREDDDPAGNSKPDITIKNFEENQLNRFELSIKINNTNRHNVMHFLNLLGCKFEFSVKKHCHIFFNSEYTVVYYSFYIKNKNIKIIEIELNKIDFDIINNFEELMSAVRGFDPEKTIQKSKFQIIKELK